MRLAPQELRAPRFKHYFVSMLFDCTVLVPVSFKIRNRLEIIKRKRRILILCEQFQRLFLFYGWTISDMFLSICCVMEEFTNANFYMCQKCVIDMS